MRPRATTNGAPKLFRAEGSPISDNDLGAARAFADVTTIAILQHRATIDAWTLNEQLTHALTARITAEQAKGVLADRADVDIDAAFAWLIRHARNHNLRLVTRAQQFIDGTVTLDTIENHAHPQHLSGSASTYHHAETCSVALTRGSRSISDRSQTAVSAAWDR